MKATEQHDFGFEVPFRAKRVTSVPSRKKEELRECLQCGRKAEVDSEVGQCVHCNAAELRECTRRVLVEQLPPQQAWAYANEAERRELALLMDPDEPCLQLGRIT